MWEYVVLFAIFFLASLSANIITESYFHRKFENQLGYYDERGIDPDGPRHSSDN